MPLAARESAVLRRVRIRFATCVVAIAGLPMMALAAFVTFLAPDRTGIANENAGAFLAAAIVILLVLLGVATWAARHVLRPAVELERAYATLSGLYASARSALLRDMLTGLGNHRAFHEELFRQVERRSGQPSTLCMVLIDLDQFKLINDRLGHTIGDRVLADMGRLTSSLVRDADVAFRIGGDEFALLLPDADCQTGRAIAMRLLANALEVRGSTLYGAPFSFSAGVACIPHCAPGPHALFEYADRALYRAKAQGRTGVAIFDPRGDDRSHGHSIEVSAPSADQPSHDLGMARPS